MSGKLASEPDGAWRPWSIWLPCAPTFACSGALIMAAGAAAVMGSWDTPAPGLSSLAIGVAGQGVLAAVDVGILMAGAKQIAEHIGGYSQVTGMTAGHGA